MNAFSFVGWSGSGKTTLISRLIHEFESNGKTVVAVKNAKHKYYLEPESSDTFKFLESGAREVCLIAKNEWLIMKPKTETTDMMPILQAQYATVDLLLLEGLTSPDIPIIEVFDADKHDGLKFPVEQLHAIICNKPFVASIPVFHRNDIDAIIGFIKNDITNKNN
ncbi:MAG: molybdopterin-guanine dinucleotide biosynthesis protein B [Candidatus Omnitrophota bacterium]